MGEQKQVERFWVWVDTRMSELGIKSDRELSLRAKLSHSAINTARRREQMPTRDTGNKMAIALEVSQSEFWAIAENKKLGNLQGIDLQIIEALSKADDEFKKRLLAIIEIYVAKERCKSSSK